MDKFIWKPGQGYNEIALERLRAQFIRPQDPMGEAWFNTDERYMFLNLYEDLNKLHVRDLMEPLEAIASGTSSFGYRAEWSKWFHYLLGQLIPRSHEYYVEYLLEYLITAFMTQYPDGFANQPYEGFSDDVLNTIGKCIMDRVCWHGNQIAIGHILQPSNNNPARMWCWFDASGDFSASLFFCLKYLPSEGLKQWFLSILNIDSPHWRSQLIVWLVGAYNLLHGKIKTPSEFSEDARPSADWAWSHCIKGEYIDKLNPDNKVVSEFLPEKNRMILLQVLDETISYSLFSEWLKSISEYDYLEKELGDIPISFIELYVNK